MNNFFKFFFKKEKILEHKSLEKASELGFITKQEQLELEIERAKEKLKEYQKKRK